MLQSASGYVWQLRDVAEASSVELADHGRYLEPSPAHASS